MRIMRHLVGWCARLGPFAYCLDSITLLLHTLQQSDRCFSLPTFSLSLSSFFCCSVTCWAVLVRLLFVLRFQTPPWVLQHQLLPRCDLRCEKGWSYMDSSNQSDRIKWERVRERESDGESKRGSEGKRDGVRQG